MLSQLYGLGNGQVGLSTVISLITPNDVVDLLSEDAHVARYSRCVVSSLSLAFLFQFFC